MKLPFLRKAARAEASARPGLMRYAQIGWARGQAPASYEALAQRGFIENPIARSAVRLVAEGAASAPLRVSPAGHPAERLLEAPSLGVGGPELIESIAAYLVLNGNAFIETAVDDEGNPQALYALRPERVTVEPGADGWPAAYVYKAGGAATRYPASTRGGRPGLLHVRTFHPLDDLYGLGGLSAAAQAVETHNAASRWNAGLLENAARPSGALVYDPGEPGATLAPEQFDRLKAEMEAQFQGAANAGRPMLLEGGLRWQAMSLSPAELDYAGAKSAAAREIALAFGVPPLLLGLPGDNTHANYAEANRALWRLTILPLLEKIAAALAAHLRCWWPELSVSVDRDAVPALAADRAELWAQVSAAGFLSDEEKRRMLGVGEMA